MSWESDAEPVEGGRDWSKYVWYGVGLAVVVMLVLLLIPKSVPVTKTRARVKHILITFDSRNAAELQAARETAQSVRERLLDGESFSKLAKDYSDDQHSAALGGEVGWVRRGELTGAIDKYIWTAPLNEVSEVILTSYGLHIVVVIDREIAEAELYERRLQERIREETTGTAQP